MQGLRLLAALLDHSLAIGAEIPEMKEVRLGSSGLLRSLA